MPIYEYECSNCQYYFEELRPFDSDPDKCPDCGGEIRRILSVFSATGFATPTLVRSESGMLAQRVSETDERNIEALISPTRVDLKGRPKITPTSALIT